MEPQEPERLVAFLKSSRTVRFFEPEPVPQEILDDVLEVARSSGSARNRQPWEFVVVRDRRTLGGLAGLEGHAQHLSGAAAEIVLVMAGDPEKFEQEPRPSHGRRYTYPSSAWRRVVLGSSVP